MERKKRERYSSEFRRQAVERMNACDNIVALARELGVGRRLLYDYRDLGDLSQAVEEFIERYYNPRRSHSALGYRSPGEFEQEKAQAGSDVASAAAVMTFLGR